MYLNIVVVGTGGTGGAFLTRFCQFLAGKPLNEYHLVICDGDQVEAKNTSRQPFMPCDISRNKACVLSEIFNDMYGLEISYSPFYIENAEDIESLFYHYPYRQIKVLIGTVDNHAARLCMDQYFRMTKGPIIYMDSGNEFQHGQVVFGVKNAKGQIISPPAADYFPEILQGGKPKSQTHCEEINQSFPQHLATNNWAASILFSAASFFMADNEKNIPTGITYFDAFKMWTRHDEVSEEYLASFAKKKRSKKEAKDPVPKKGRKKAEKKVGA